MAADPYPEYEFDQDDYGTVPSTTQGPMTVAPTAAPKSRRGMSGVEIGVIAVAIAIAILAFSMAASLSQRR